jgi:hypothetical protein
MTLRPVFLLLGLTLTTPIAAAEPDLDAVLQGFDEPADSAPTSEPALDDVLGGFEDGNSGADDSNEVVVDTKPWELGGAFILGAAWNYAHDAPESNETDFRGLSRLRAKLNLEFDADLGGNWESHLSGYGWQDAAYAINGRNDYTDEVLEEYESEAELSEAWLQGRLNSRTDLKLGRQIVVWGKSDNIRVTDVLNPLDNREPGMVDIEDLRLPLATGRLDYYVGDWGVSAMAIPEIRFNKNPPYGSDFYPYPAQQPDEAVPGDGGDSTEYALAANGIFSGWDLSLYWAQLYNDTPHLVTTSGGPELQHNRLTMLGFATNVAIENWLLKAEAARFSGFEYDALPGETFSRIDSLLGVEYSGFSETTLTLEVANRHLPDYDKALQPEGVEEDEWQSALRYQGDFMHDRLHLLALLSAFGRNLNEGGFGRYSLQYDLADALSLTGGIVDYSSGDKVPFNAIGDNDRLFLDLKYSF